VKYTDDLVSLAEMETVLQGMIDRSIKTEGCCEMEINVEIHEGSEDLKGTIPITGYDRSETTAECGIFEMFG
jgi:hypothetical protein